MALDVMYISKILDQQTLQINSKVTDKNIKKNPHSFEDQPLLIEIVQKFWSWGQIWDAINLLKETLSNLNCHTPFSSCLDLAKMTEFLWNMASQNLPTDT